MAHLLDSHLDAIPLAPNDDRLTALAEAGVTDFAPSEYCLQRDEWQNTRELLVELAGANNA